MKFDKIELIGTPKSLNLWDIIEWINPNSTNPDDVLYDGYPGDDRDDWYQTMDIFHYYQSTTGIHVVYNSRDHYLLADLPKWANDADIDLLVLIVNTILRRHPRVKAYTGDTQFKEISPEDVEKMKETKYRYLMRKITKKEPFDMVGIRIDLTVDEFVEDPHDMAHEVQRQFVDAQWNFREYE